MAIYLSPPSYFSFIERAKRRKRQRAAQALSFSSGYFFNAASLLKADSMAVDAAC